MSDTNSRISVSEDKLKLLFAEFKLELVKEMNAFARTADVEKWKEGVELRLRKVEDSQTGSSAVGRYKLVLAGFAVTIAAAGVGALLYLLAQAVTG